jgi:hypothetical protein
VCFLSLFNIENEKKTKKKEKRDRAKREGGCFGLKKKEKEKWWVVYIWSYSCVGKKEKRNRDIERFEFEKVYI